MRQPSQLEFAKRRNEERRLRQAWMEGLTRACGLEVLPEQFLSFEEADPLREAFFEKLKATKQSARVNFPTDSIFEIGSVLVDISIDLGTNALILMGREECYPGAVRLAASTVLLNFKAIWKVVRSDFCVATQDLVNGLCIESTYYDLTGEYRSEGVLELVGWGVFQSLISNSARGDR